ncbi:MAG: AbrB/MazE/SpoVT family DNA-binding domain-containing protein [Bacillota bacterium]
MIVELKNKSQVTIPKELVTKLDLKVGDQLHIEEKDGKIVITPVVVIPKDQDWYYARRWIDMEKEVDRQIEEKKIHSADDTETLFKDLEIDE